MRFRDYDLFKLLDVANPDPGAADGTVAWVATQPYVVVLRNCMDATYDVLRSYGVSGLPLPMLEITPNNWFDRLSGIAKPVSQVTLMEARLLPERRVNIAATTEWQQFHEELLSNKTPARATSYRNQV
jgi:hypothetical protein